MKCIVIISNEGESMCVCVCVAGGVGGAGGKWGGDRRQRWRFSKGDPRSCCLPRRQVKVMFWAERAGRMEAVVLSGITVKVRVNADP